MRCSHCLHSEPIRRQPSLQGLIVWVACSLPALPHLFVLRHVFFFYFQSHRSPCHVISCPGPWNVCRGSWRCGRGSIAEAVAEAVNNFLSTRKEKKQNSGGIPVDHQSVDLFAPGAWNRCPRGPRAFDRAVQWGLDSGSAKRSWGVLHQCCTRPGTSV